MFLVGSESSSGISPRPDKETSKKKVHLVDTKSRNGPTKCRSTARSTTQTTPKNSRAKSIENAQNKTPTATRSNATVTRSASCKKTPNSLPLSSTKKEVRRTNLTRTNSTNRTPACTPSDDGRWPSVNSRPAPLMNKAVRNIFSLDETKRVQNSNDLKTLDKYGTLPRRRRDRSVDNPQNQLSRENSLNRPTTLTTTKRVDLLQKPLVNVKRKIKTKIYHETSVQTAMTADDIEKAFSGVAVKVNGPQDVEKCDSELQVEIKSEEYLELIKKHEALTRLHEELKKEMEERNVKLNSVEEQLKYEIAEKNSLRKELRQNTDRVLAILGKDSKNSEGNNNIPFIYIVCIYMEFRLHFSKKK